MFVSAQARSYGSVEERSVHTGKVAGSNPARTTTSTLPGGGCFFVPGRPMILSVPDSQRTRLSPATGVCLGFLGLVAVGTGLLASPPAAPDGRPVELLDALFTATSAACLTGLITVDTASAWSTFGLVTILALIQLGGLGFMTLASLMGMVLGGRLGVRRRLSATAEGRGTDLGDVGWLIRATVIFTLAVETVVAAALTVRFHLEYGYPWARAAWEGIFHAISSFNNAGFALYPDNVMRFSADPWILLTLAGALMIGGLGFPVLLETARRIRGSGGRWSLTARFTWIGTGILVVAGTVLVGVGEWSGALAAADDRPGIRLLNAFFAGVSPRTAGFNALDYANFNPSTLLGTDVLMFIGGGSGGTAGGVKITTAAVLLAAIVAEARGSRSVDSHGRAIPPRVIRQALAVLAAALVLVFGSTMMILVTAPWAAMEDVLFEVVSAFATVGLSTGITADLPPVAQLNLIVLMYAGRVGPLVLAAALAARARDRLFDYPEERPFIG